MVAIERKAKRTDSSIEYSQASSSSPSEKSKKKAKTSSRSSRGDEWSEAGTSNDYSDSDSSSTDSDADEDEDYSLCGRSKVGLALDENIDSACALACARIKISRKQIFKCQFGNLFSLVFLSSILLVSMYVQYVIGSFIAPLISLDEYAEKLDVEGEGNLFVRWRNSPLRGAKPVMTLPGETHGDLACSERQWSWEEDVIDDIGKYRRKMTFLMMFPIGSGHFVGIVTLSLWVCTAVAQLRAWGGFLLLAFLPEFLTEEAVAAIEESHKAGGAMMDFSRHRAKICIVLVGIGRGMLIADVAYNGVLFLAMSDNLKDFILNSVALAFVFELPQLLYKAFAMTTLMDDLQTIRSHFEDKRVRLKVPNFLVYALGPFCMMIGAVVFILGYRKLWLLGNELELDVYEALCNVSKHWTENIEID